MTIAFTILFTLKNDYLKKAVGTVLGMSFAISTFGEIGAIVLRYFYVMLAIGIVAVFEYLRKIVRRIEHFLYL